MSYSCDEDLEQRAEIQQAFSDRVADGEDVHGEATRYY